jgi:polyhydroxybutyrate depolymerase
MWQLGVQCANKGRLLRNQIVPRNPRRAALLAAALSLGVVMQTAVARDMNVEAIVIGGRQRLYAIDGATSPGPRPTMLILHGAGGTFRALGSLPDVARGVGVVTVVPQGIGGRWNFFPPGRESEVDRAFFDRLGGLPDDEGFLRDLTSNLVARGIADPQRIYVVGLSLGGVMALRMACMDSKLFAGMALVIAGMEESTGANCRPAKPFRVLMVRGTADQTIPDAGGLTVRGDRIWSTDRLVSFFRQLNGCGAAAARSVATHFPQRIETESSVDCSGGPIVLYRVIGGGHEVPSVLNVESVILDFFQLQTLAPLPVVTVGPMQSQRDSPDTMQAPSPLPPVTVAPRR